MKKAIRNAVSAILLVFALLVTQIPTTEVVADTAAASDFQLNGSTLVKYVGTASSVSIPATVNRIGEEAFAGNTTIKKVTFKGEIESIAYRAFAGCSELQEIKLPDSVTELGNGAFSDCSALETFYLGKNLETLGLGVFAGCSSLKEITLAEDQPYFTVADGCLYNKDKTKLYLLIPVREKETYSMPSTVTDIAAYAFWGCNSLKNLSLSNTLKEIPAYSFSNCKSLQALSVPYSVQSIDVRAFSDCVNLENVVIPPTVTSIHETAFDGCPKLKIVADVGTVGYNYYERWQERWNQSEYEDTGNNAGDNEDEDRESEQGKEHEKESLLDVLGQTYVVGNSAVVFIDNSAANVYGVQEPAANPNDGQSDHAGESGQSGVDGTEEEQSKDIQAGIIPDETVEKSISIPKFTVAGETILADQAYYQSQDMTNYEFPEEITEIGEFTFARSNLQKARIPEGVTTIGYGAFYHCEELRNVVIPSTVTDIEPRAFDETLWLKNWMSGGEGDYLVVGDGILLAYRGAYATITLPENVRRIAPGVFAGHRELVHVTLPDSLREIGEGAFEGCYNLKTIEGGTYVTVIEDGAFAGCSMETYHVTDKVKELGLGVVDYTDTQKSISTKVVVFDHQETLPVCSYEETATRLSNAEARKYALNDVLFAIVDKSVRAEELEGTVLDPNNYGFHGIVAYISSQSRSIVTALACNMTREELENTYIPEFIYIDGKAYQVEGLNNLKIFAEDSGNGQFAAGGVTVSNTSSFGTDSRIEASLEGDTGSFYLKLENGEAGAERITEAYKAVYGQKMPGGTTFLDLSLVEMPSGVSITKLGSNRLIVEFPSEIVEGSGSLRVVMLDRNGQLEGAKYRLTGGTIQLVLDHTGPVAIYRTDSANSGKMDISPDTGEAVHPKWFLAIGLTCLSAAVFFRRPRRKAIV